MRTYLDLYVIALANLKTIQAQHDLSPAGEKAFDKALTRALRLNQKVKSEETVYTLTPAAWRVLERAS